MKKNNMVALILLLLFTLALLVVVPVHKGVLFGRDILLGLDLKGGIRMVYKADLSGVEASKQSEIIDGVVAVITNRVNPLGVSEPVISRQGADRIVVELPGLSLSDAQKDRIGRTALLEFRELKTDDQGKQTWVPATGTIDGQEKVLNSSYFKSNTYVNRNPTSGQIYLYFEWTSEGAKLSEQITTRMIGQPLGIFEGDQPLLGDDGRPIAPTVNAVITDSGIIEGLSLKEATELSKQLNAGRLPVALDIVYEQDVSPVLGSDFVALGVKAGIIGILLVMLFMILYYRLPGVVSALALAFYGVLVMAIFKLIPVTLTLAGIGGFIISVGMAVDANVLIFERMKEELKAGRTIGAAVEAGFNRAWSAIRDSNVTTWIACGVLYWIGSTVAAGAPVKGFALTLFIGVAVSMFTAVTVTRTLMRLLVSTRLSKKTWLFTMGR